MVASLTAAELTFEKTLVEVKAKPDVEVVHAKFAFENKSKETITITRYNAPCSCMSAKIIRADKKKSMSFAPGEKGEIEGILEFGNFKGTIDKGIQLYTDQNDGDEPVVELTTRVHIPVLIDAEPTSLSWRVGEQKAAKEVWVKIMEGVNIKVVSMDCGFGTEEKFDIEQGEAAEGVDYVLKVRPKATDKPILGVVRLRTDSEIERYKVIQIFVTVRPAKK